MEPVQQGGAPPGPPHTYAAIAASAESRTKAPNLMPPGVRGGVHVLSSAAGVAYSAPVADLRDETAGDAKEEGQRILAEHLKADQMEREHMVSVVQRLLASMSLGHAREAVAELQRISTSKQQLVPASRQSSDSAAGAAAEPASSSLHDFSQYGRDWNSEFQGLVEHIGRDESILNQEDAFGRLSMLARDFLFAAQTLGRIIISERCLPNKTIPPLAHAPGFAGGVKYLAHNILFKFAVDHEGLYGSDEQAMKAAGHELRGLSCVYRALSTCNREDLHVPLCCLIDYRGYRLIAVSRLPITRDTITYGSHDAGGKLHNDGEFALRMERLAQVLNLKKHEVADLSGQRTLFYGPFDIEGHRGMDGRNYLLDFHRVFPCEPPAAFTGRDLFGSEANSLVNALSGPADELVGADKDQMDAKRAVAAPPSSSVSVPCSPLVGVSSSFSVGDSWNFSMAQSGAGNEDSSFASSLRRVALRMGKGRRGGGGGHTRSNTSAPGSGRSTPSIQRTNQAHGSVGVASAPHLSRMLRPELVRLSTVPLSSDAFAKMGGDASSQREVRRAFAFMLLQQIPEFAGFLGSSPRGSLTHQDLVAHLHRFGINVRFLGHVRSCCRVECWRDAILAEIIARVLKNTLHRRFRAIMSGISYLAKEPFRVNAVEFCNLVFDNSPLSSFHSNAESSVMFSSSRPHGGEDEKKGSYERVSGWRHHVVEGSEHAELVVNQERLTQRRTASLEFWREYLPEQLAQCFPHALDRELHGMLRASGSVPAHFFCMSPGETAPLIAQLDLRSLCLERGIMAAVFARFVELSGLVLAPSFRPYFAQQPSVSNGGNGAVGKFAPPEHQYQRAPLYDQAALSACALSRSVTHPSGQAAPTPLSSSSSSSSLHHSPQQAPTFSFPTSGSSRVYRQVSAPQPMVQITPQSAPHSQQQHRNDLWPQDEKKKDEDKDDESVGIEVEDDVASLCSDYSGHSSGAGALAAAASSASGPAVRWFYDRPMEEVHLEDITERVKQMHIISYAEGTALFIKSLNMQRRGHQQEAVQLALLAREKFHEVLRYNMNDFMALCNMSFMVSSIFGDSAESFRLLERALKANPFHVRSWYYMGLQRRYGRIFSEAKRCFEKAIALSNFTHCNALKDLGNLMRFQFNDLVEAEKCYNMALQADPTHTKSLINLAKLLLFRGDFQRTLDCFRRAAMSTYGELDAQRHALGNYLNFLRISVELYVEIDGNLDLARELYASAMQQWPQHAALLHAYAMFAERCVGDLTLADTLFHRAVQAQCSLVYIPPPPSGGSADLAEAAAAAGPESAASTDGSSSSSSRTKAMERFNAFLTSSAYPRLRQAMERPAHVWSWQKQSGSWYCLQYANFLRFSRADSAGAEHFYRMAVRASLAARGISAGARAEKDPEMDELLEQLSRCGGVDGQPLSHDTSLAVAAYAEFLWRERRLNNEAQRLFQLSIGGPDREEAAAVHQHAPSFACSLALQLYGDFLRTVHHHEAERGLALLRLGHKREDASNIVACPLPKNAMRGRAASRSGPGGAAAAARDRPPKQLCRRAQWAQLCVCFDRDLSQFVRKYTQQHSRPQQRQQQQQLSPVNGGRGRGEEGAEANGGRRRQQRQFRQNARPQHQQPPQQQQQQPQPQIDFNSMEEFPSLSRR